MRDHSVFSFLDGPVPYQRPTLLFSRHLESIIPSLFRQVKMVAPEEFILDLPDGDFVEYDHYRTGSRQLVILCHGLEGNSRKAYMRGMAKAMTRAGADVVAWNYRCCGKKINRLDRLYHCGATDDLDAVVRRFQSQYEQIRLVGFSLGGNLVLKYLGEEPTRASMIKAAVTISVPVDIKSASFRLSSPSNYVYSRYFLSGMTRKIRNKAMVSEKMRRFDLKGVRSVFEFDERVTAPLHGFNSALDYYQRNGARQFLNSIQTPTLILNAKNDPFLTPECSPAVQFADHPYVRFLTPQQGGHVGFSRMNGPYFSEEVAIQFFTTTATS